MTTNNTVDGWTRAQWSRCQPVLRSSPGACMNATLDDAETLLLNEF
ncbi:hypothetical protein [Leucobacter sp. G161]|nr:hypothetical protein [Leucobacter sp. G161]